MSKCHQSFECLIRKRSRGFFFKSVTKLFDPNKITIAYLAYLGKSNKQTK